MSAFYPGVRPTDLIPGDPSTLRSVAARIAALADGFSSAANDLRAIDSGSWRGKAADAFRYALGQQPGHYSSAASSFSESASAVRSYAGTLEAAQHTASLAIAAYAEAQSATTAWRHQQVAAAAHHIPVSAFDPGASGRARANAILDAAHAEERAGVRTLRSVLEAAGHAAPRHPSLAGELRSGLDRMARAFVRYEHVIVSGGASLALRGPRTATRLGRELGMNVRRDPVSFVRALLNHSGDYQKFRLLRALVEAETGRIIHDVTRVWPHIFHVGNGRLGGLKSKGFLSKRFPVISIVEDGIEATYNAHKHGMFDGSAVGPGVEAVGTTAALMVAGTAGGFAFSTGVGIGAGMNWMEKKITGQSISDQWANEAVGGELEGIEAQADSLVVTKHMSEAEMAQRNAALVQVDKQATDEVRRTKNPLYVLGRML